MSKFISVGKILNFHGIQGEARVGFSKNQQDFLLSLNEVFVKTGSEYKPLTIIKSRIHKNFAIMKFEGINAIDELLPYKGELLFVKEATIREKLEEDEFLIDELVGLSVYDAEDNKLGFVVGVSNNGATDLLSVKTNSKKISLVPFVKAIVTNVSIKDKKITINNLEGLLE
ncbi:MAG: 16S rRNA processing protein RimM [Brachyspira sp.]|jgi:16S rRNA processing protein rimM|nr:16S rRNA processing protein RimM [Brachyspira sp.]